MKKLLTILFVSVLVGLAIPQAYAQTCPPDTDFDEMLGLCVAEPDPILCPEDYNLFGACTGDPEFFCDVGIPNIFGQCTVTRSFFDPCPAGFEPAGTFQCIKPAEASCSFGTFVEGFNICSATPLTGHCPDGTTFDELIGLCTSLPTDGDCNPDKTFDAQTGLCISVPEFTCSEGQLVPNNECRIEPSGSIFDFPPTLSCPGGWELRQTVPLNFGCFRDANPNCQPGFFLEEQVLCAEAPISPTCPAMTEYDDLSFNNFACFSPYLPDCPANTQLDLDASSDTFQLCTAMAQLELTLDDQIQSLIDEVDSQVSEGEINPRTGSSLNWLLDAALNADSQETSISTLESFIARLNLFIDRGMIPADVGQELIDSAQAIIDGNP